MTSVTPGRCNLVAGRSEFTREMAKREGIILAIVSEFQITFEQALGLVREKYISSDMDFVEAAIAVCFKPAHGIELP